MGAKNGQRGSHLVRGIGGKAAHRLLQPLGLERASAQGLERPSHTAKLIGACRRGYRFVEFTAAQARDSANQDLHRTRQSALDMNDGKGAESDDRTQVKASDEQHSK